MIQPGDHTENSECWQLSKMNIGTDDLSIEENVLPVVRALRKFGHTYEVK